MGGIIVHMGGKKVGMITLKEYAERLGKEKTSIRRKAQQGGFVTAKKIGRDWFIDEGEPFIDRRVTSGRYVNWRKKKG